MYEKYKVSANLENIYHSGRQSMNMINIKAVAEGSQYPTFFGNILLALSVAIIPPFFSYLFLPAQSTVIASLSLYGLILLASLIWALYASN